MSTQKMFLGSLVLAVLLVSCDSDNDSIDVTDHGIKLSANVIDSHTKTKANVVNGPINSTFTIDFPIGMYAYDSELGWRAGASNSSTPNTPNLINNDSATVSGAAGHAISFATGPYYYPSGGEVVNFYAYAPYATETTAADTDTAPKVTINLTGQQDVMYATSTGHKSGSSSIVAPVMNFVHKLIQLQFTFQSGTGYPVSGNSVVSLLVKAQPNSLVLNVGDGSFTTSGSADMQALSTANQTAGIGITAAGTNANSPVITVPASGATAYTLDVVVKPAIGNSTITYTGVPVNITTVTGNAHMITLTFNGTSITASTTVADWATGTGASVPVQ